VPEAGSVNIFERGLRSVDRAQQRYGPTAFVYAVIKKFGDDRGGSLAALLTFYGFLSLFPLLLLLVTILGFIGGNDHSFFHRVEASAFSQFPIVGSKLSSNIHQLHRKSVIALVVGIAGVLWGSQGAIQSAQYAQAEVWNIPGEHRPNFWARGGRTLIMMGTLFVFLVSSTALTGVVTFGHRSLPVIIGGIVGTVALNIALFAVAFRILTPKHVDWTSLYYGSVAGGVGWTALQYLGGILINHTLRNTSQVYGFFAVILGLLGWIYLGAQITLYAAEINVVKARHLWPRAIVQPPLTGADERVLAAIVMQGKRRPEQSVSVGYRNANAAPFDPLAVEGTSVEGPQAVGEGGRGGH
jgi:YihY family inner membrane protein